MDENPLQLPFNENWMEEYEEVYKKEQGGGNATSSSNLSTDSSTSTKD